jgi:uncharacterized protein YyaL (SSP411 family)
MVLTFLEAHQLTRQPSYLARASETLDFVLSGWDEQIGGGIWWHEAHRDGTKNACVNGPAAVGCLRLARRRTGASAKRLLERAQALVEWTVQALQDADGLFDDRKVVATGEVKKGKLTYNSALMLRAFLGLHRVTGRTQHLEEAKRIGRAADWFLDEGTGAYRDPVKWSHLQVEADLELHRATKDEHVLSRAKRNADVAYAGWKAGPPDDLISNASIARMLWLLADTETDAGRAFWVAADGSGG